MRRQHMRALLEDQLGIPAERITYLMGASSRRWGRWRGIELLDQARERAAGRQHWWMQTTLCDSPEPKGLGNASAPACLRSRYAECLGRPAGHDGELTVLPRLCRELCYTLSVSSALHAFLQSIHTTGVSSNPPLPVPGPSEPSVYFFLSSVSALEVTTSADGGGGGGARKVCRSNQS